MHDSAGEGVAVGFFDGVHLGHQAILRGAAAALTFRDHPLAVVRPEAAPRLIMPTDERLDTLRSLGLKEVVAMEFTPELAAMEARTFAMGILLPLASRHTAPGKRPLVRCGANWRFGKAAQGDAALLRELGFDVAVVPFAMFNGARVSSTRIREAIERGAVDEAAAMLSRPWILRGHIAKGKGLGGKLGFPTLNVIPDGLQLRLPRGVYAAEFAGSRAVANFGRAPTLGDAAWNSDVLEAHLLEPGQAGAPLPTPGDPAEIALIRRIRDERRFDSLDELAAQIARDCRDAGQASHPQASAAAAIMV